MSGAGLSLLFVVGVHRWHDRWCSSLVQSLAFVVGAVVGVRCWHASLAFVVDVLCRCRPHRRALSMRHLPGCVPTLLLHGVGGLGARHSWWGVVVRG
jgi:hypothetical protein